MGLTVANGSTPKTQRKTRESQKCPNLCPTSVLTYGWADLLLSLDGEPVLT